MKRLYRQYARKCESKGIPLQLTLEQFERLTSANCFYCDRPPSHHCRTYLHNGIDRVVGPLGYVKGNCVPCCWECNRIKGSELTAGEMRAVALALKKHRTHQ